MKCIITNEIDLALNLAHYKKLISFCTRLGKTYKPSRADMQIPMLQAIYDDAISAIESDQIAQATLAIDDKERVLVFDGLEQHVARIIDALDASGVPEEIIKIARTYEQKIQGKGATPSEEAAAPGKISGIATTPVAAVPAANGTFNKTTRYSLQRQFEKRAEYFAHIIVLLQTQPAYKPKKDDLTIPVLIKKQAAMMAANKKSHASFTCRTITRLNRKEKFNHPIAGLAAIGNSTKRYIRSVLGAHSFRYLEIRSFRFSKDIE